MSRLSETSRAASPSIPTIPIRVNIIDLPANTLRKCSWICVKILIKVQVTKHNISSIDINDIWLFATHWLQYNSARFACNITCFHYENVIWWHDKPLCNWHRLWSWRMSSDLICSDRRPVKQNTSLYYPQIKRNMIWWNNLDLNHRILGGFRVYLFSRFDKLANK